MENRQNCKLIPFQSEIGLICRQIVSMQTSMFFQYLKYNFMFFSEVQYAKLTENHGVVVFSYMFIMTSDVNKLRYTLQFSKIFCISFQLKNGFCDFLVVAEGKLEMYASQYSINNLAGVTVVHYFYYISHIYRCLMINIIFFSLFNILIKCHIVSIVNSYKF